MMPQRLDLKYCRFVAPVGCVFGGCFVIYFCVKIVGLNDIYTAFSVKPEAHQDAS